MNVRVIVACVISLAVIVSRASAAPPVEDRLDDLEKRAANLEARLKKQTSDIERLTNSVTSFGKSVDTLADQLEKGDKDRVQLAADVKALQDGFRTLTAEMKSLRTKSNTLIEQIREDLQYQRRILSAITEDGGNGGTIVSLRGAMESDKGRRQLADVVNQSLARKGTLRIHNTMPYEEQISVNGRSYRIQAGVTLVLSDLPVGSVTTELVGREAPRNWTIAPPTYEESIDIGPRRAPVEDAPIVSEVEPIVRYWP
jgi:prefoldin subunit 5